jgi:hypothetical protein
MVTGERPPEGMTVAMMGGMAAGGDQTALEVFSRVGRFIGKAIRPILEEQKSVLALRLQALHDLPSFQG